MRTLAGLLLCAVALQPATVRAELYYLIVSGFGGEPRYEERFAAEAQAMANAAERTLGDSERIMLLSGETATREALRASFADLQARTGPEDRLAVFLIGHGSYDGREYKFNLPGQDIEGSELNDLLTALPARNQLVVNMTSSTGSLREAWKAEGRALITAQRGNERNATRFSTHWAEALSSDDADLDKNGSISAQEAYDYTARIIEASFEEDGILPTEHPELAGDAASAFEVSRLRERVAATPAVELLHDRREELEEAIAALRLRREELGDDYLPQLQNLLVELALVQEQIDEATAE